MIYNLFDEKIKSLDLSMWRYCHSGKGTLTQQCQLTYDSLAKHKKVYNQIKRVLINYTTQKTTISGDSADPRA
jgi:hypothetical protein